MKWKMTHEHRKGWEPPNPDRTKAWPFPGPWGDLMHRSINEAAAQAWNDPLRSPNNSPHSLA